MSFWSFVVMLYYCMYFGTGHWHLLHFNFNTCLFVPVIFVALGTLGREGRLKFICFYCYCCCCFVAAVAVAETVE